MDVITKFRSPPDNRYVTFKVRNGDSAEWTINKNDKLHYLYYGRIGDSIKLNNDYAILILKRKNNYRWYQFWKKNKTISIRGEFVTPNYIILQIMKDINYDLRH